MRHQPGSTARLLAATLIVAALASCGGSGGGGGSASGPMPTLALTASNAPNVAGDAITAGVQTADKNPFLGLGAQLTTGNAPGTHILSRFIEQQVRQVLQAGPAVAAAIAPTAVDPNCPNGGSLTEVQNGSSIVRTFSACSPAPGATINGTIVISGVSGTASSFSASVSTNLTFSFTGFADQTFAGSFTFSETMAGTSITITLSGANLVLHQGTNTENLGSFELTTTVDTSIADTVDILTFSYSSTEIGGTVLVRTLTPFQINPGSDKPHAGALQIIGVNGSSIKVTVHGDELALSPQVTIEVDADGNGIFETTLPLDWNALK